MKSFLLAMVILTWGSALGPAAAPRTNVQYRMEATAFDLSGITRAGTRPQRGVVFADAAFLPLGARIRVTGAGHFSGIYLVTDTGGQSRSVGTSTFTSRILAKRFGTKLVSVSVLKWGQGKVPRPADRAAGKTAPHAVKRAAV